jgi:hypothetical protein
MQRDVVQIAARHNHRNIIEALFGEDNETLEDRRLYHPRVLCAALNQACIRGHMGCVRLILETKPDYYGTLEGMATWMC